MWEVAQQAEMPNAQQAEKKIQENWLLPQK